MKYTFLAFCICISTLSPLAYTHAETSVRPIPPRKNFEERIDSAKERFEHTRERMVETKERIEVRHEALRAQFGEKRTEVLDGIFVRIEERFQRVIDKMRDVAVRIQGHIDVMQAAEVTLGSAAQEHLDETHTFLDEAEKALATITVDTQASTTPASAFSNVREQYTEVQTLLKSARAKFSETIVLLKAVRQDVSDSVEQDTAL